MIETNRTLACENGCWIRHKVQLSSMYAAIPMTISILILISNTLILVTLARVKKRRLQDLFLLGLSIGDLLTSIPVASNAVCLLTGFATLNQSVCNLWATALHSCVGTTFCIHSAICLEKCYSIVKPVEHRAFEAVPDSTRKVTCGVFVAFLLPWTVFFTLSFAGEIRAEFSTTLAFCHFMVAFTATSVIGCLIGVPLVIELVTHAVILHRVKTRILSSQQRKKIFKAMKTVVLTVGIFYVCNVPSFILSFCEMIMKTEFSDMALFAVTQVIMANSFMNYFIYFSSVPRFRDAVYTMFRFDPRVHPENGS